MSTSKSGLFRIGRQSRRNKGRVRCDRHRRRRVFVEPLEDRRLLALVGVEPLGFPTLFSVGSAAGGDGQLTYDSGTQQFAASALPLVFQEMGGAPVFVTPAKSFELQIEVDNLGNLVGGVLGDDLLVTGSIDLDGDGTADATGTLLQGEVLEFGFDDAAPTTQGYDFRFAVTGGALATGGTLSGGGVFPAFFDGYDIGITIDSENSTYDPANGFEVDFSGDVKATLGTIAPVDPVLPADVGDFVWHDSNYNGIQDDGNTGINGVSVALYADVDGDGNAEPGGDDGAPVDTTITANDGGSDGAYSFANLSPGDYFVVFDVATLPAGTELTVVGAGSDPAVDSDADPFSGATAVFTLASGQSDLTWDAGVVDTIAPAIALTKYVDKVITESQQVVIDFDSLATGTVVSTQFAGLVVGATNARVPGAGNHAMIFDSASPSGGDVDLGTPNQSYPGGVGVGSGGGPSGGGPNADALSKVLIISEDGDTSDPDDEAQGGTITFTFDTPVTVDTLDLLDIDSDELGGSIITFTTSSGSHSQTIPALGNNSFQSLTIDVAEVEEMTVTLVGSGAISELRYTTTTEEKQWFDANDPPGIEFEIGEEIEFSYHVTNPGDVSLAPIDISDDNATPGDNSDDFVPAAVLAEGTLFNIGDVDQDDELDPGEEWIFTAAIVATTVGQFTNTADTVGSPVNGDGDVIGDPVAASDPANYTVVGTEGITIEKSTNGIDADSPELAVEIASGGVVTWSYAIENTGTVSFALAEVTVTDDHGTPDDTGDDFTPTFVAASDVMSDGILSPGETWFYEWSGTAADLSVIDPVTGQVVPTVYGNVGRVDAGAANASDRSHYQNPPLPPSAQIGDYVWNDLDRDGTQDDGEVGIAGVTVELQNSDGSVLDTTVTDSDGAYLFEGLSGGDYLLQFVAPPDHRFSPQFHGGDPGGDSDANQVSGLTDVIQLADHQADHSVDAGLYESAVDFMFEAEDYDWVESPWQVETLASASGGEYLWAPNRTGSHYNSPPSAKSVNYDVQIDTAGNYEISALVNARHRRDNSVWVKVDDQPWVQWHMDVTRSSWEWQEVTDGWRQQSRSFYLDSGSHSLQVKVREDGTKLDKFMFSRLATSTAVINATDFINDDEEIGAWMVEVDDDGNEFLMAANGTGSHYRDIPTGDEVSYQFTVDQDGAYDMFALVNAANGNDNSIWVSIDGGTWVEWHLSVTGGAWQWQQVTDGSSHHAVSFDLLAGDHTLSIKVREDGTKIDTIVISNDDGIELNQFG